MLQLIIGAVDDRSARGVAAAVSRLVSAGDLPAGARLPTVRDVARGLGISPTTVSEAWRSLARAGAIQTRGRSGTFVLTPALPRQRLRYARLTEARDMAQWSARAPRFGAVPDGAYPTGAYPTGAYPTGAHLAGIHPTGGTDLSTGVPDYDLLPHLGEALRRIGDARLTTSYLDEPVLPRLETVLRERWPYPPQQLTVVDGALDALDRITATLVRFGDHVLVENPAFPPTLDLLDTVGATVVGVPIDRQGLVPDALAEALRYDPVALYLQPRAHNPTGVSMSRSRADALARVLARHSEVTIVEDDHAGDIASAPAVSLGRRLPDRTVRVHSFSKSHGPDLRLAAIGGPASIITAIADRRLLGPGWSSRLLQAVLLELLCDGTTIERIAHARTEYARRRGALLAALASRGLRATAADGINLWLEVANQQVAMLSLAAHGVAVAPGAPFVVKPLDTDHIRITVGLVRDGFEELADLLAAAAGGTNGGSGRRVRAHPRGWR